ncbi:MAG: hypothetical protein JWP01_363, partial [Myxococcales bacterium]|nr:hypothetical protein [Myxococcales bacterium]
IAPGQFFTLGNSASDLLPAYIDYGYSADLGDFFNTDGGKLALACGSSEIDSATYEAVKEGRSRQLTAAQPPDYTVNDDQLNWCEASNSEFEASNFGTPGADNDCTPVVVGQCNDGGTMRDAVLPVEGDLIITEVMPNPAAVSDTEGEWFEIKAIHAFDLNGVGLDRAGDTSNPTEISSADCIHVTAGSYVVFAQNADIAMNGGLPAGSVLGTFSFALVDGSGAAPGDVRVMAGANVIDAISWTSTRSGKSHALDPDVADPIANDNETNFCDGMALYNAMDAGSPGVANPQCAGTTAGMCDAGGTLRPIVKPTAGDLVITEIMVNPKIETPAGQEWLEITNRGGAAFDLNGLGIDQIGTTRIPDVIISAACLSVAPNAFALLARSNNPLTNAMLPTVDATFGFGMSNTSGDVAIVDGATVLDQVTWGNVSTTAYDGRSLSLDPDQFMTTANDMITGGSPPVLGNFCLGTGGYGDMTNMGSPKATNPQCP